ncbi:hypothetical protein EDC90_100544 [Martelella mediterranea]|uniref:Extensin-like C-terminal domain-containing protein n=1 Tax=Martelella mediterranea TaxID=293089 RepID=A0A4R3NW41_9HYPH|nr:hypothetical protein EDC90_100544 [Martelella mediterranea]
MLGNRLLFEAFEFYVWQKDIALGLQKTFMTALALITMSLPVFAQEVPAEPPVPAKRPADLAETAREEKAEAKVQQEDAASLQTEDDVAFQQCISSLKALGAEFRSLETINDAGVCGIDKPIEVSVALEGVDLEPDATMRCETALLLARWARGYVDPSAKVAMGTDVRLTEIRQASAYVCRNRNNRSGGKISEHARGNAIDIRSLTFSNGQSVDMVPRKKASNITGAFQRTISASACLYFTTVLSPGSDATHQDHMHLDVIKRGGGYRYCR